MTDKANFILSHAEARRRAMSCVADAPEGYAVTVQPPKRNLEQNALLWVLLTAFSEQLEWQINGASTKLEPGEWKDILSSAFAQEHVRIAPGLNGGVVFLGLRTSTMSKPRFAEFIEFIQATAAQKNVRIEHAQEQPA